MAETDPGRSGRGEKLRLVFMGTPGFAARILEAVLGWDGGDVVGVYSQPDRPCGRGQVCKPSEVSRLALERGLPLFRPLNFKSDEAVAELAALEPDFLVVAAYGLILPQRVLDIPRLGPLNVHASLLPKYRGAAPIQRAIAAGEPVTGVTIMRMEAGLDSGPIVSQRAVPIRQDDTAESIHDLLAELGGVMIVNAMIGLVDGTLVPKPQDHSRATHAAKLDKNEGRIDWSLPAAKIHALVRALHPWPGSYGFFSLPGQAEPLRLNILPGKIGPLPSPDVPPPAPGSIAGLVDDQLAIATGDRLYLVPTVRPAGRKDMSARAFACGYLPRELTDAACAADER